MFTGKLKNCFAKPRTFLSSRSIRSNLLIALLFMALVPAAVINIFYYLMMHKEMNDKIQAYSSEVIRQVGQKIDTMLAQTELIQQQIVAMTITSGTSEYFGELSTEDKLSIPYKTDRMVTNIIRNFNPISDAYVIEINGNSYSSNMHANYELLLKEEWIRNAVDIPAAGIIIPTHYNYYHDINKADNMFPVISFIDKVNVSKGYDGNGVCIVQVDLKYSALKDIIDNAQIGEESFTLLLDESGRVIYSRNENDFGKTIENVNYNDIAVKALIEDPSLMKKNDVVLLTYKLTDSGWNMLTILPTDIMYRQLNKLSLVSLFTMIISLIAALVMSVILSRGITKPINKMVQIMRRVEEGDFGVTMPDMSYKDLHVLSSSFNIMLKKIDILMKNMVDKETEKTNAQLKALQAQINPHFLYNTLEVVRSIALENKIKSIAEIAKSLSKIFRYSINRNKEIVTLEEEIEHIRNYIKIQQFRFGNKLEAVFDIQEELMGCKIPRFIIQPLVENSVFHGIETKMDKGRIVVSVSKAEDIINIRVSDNGTGIPPDKLNSLNSALSEYGLEALKENDTSLGIGILNVNMRLKLLFGDRFRLKLTSTPLVDTTVEIQLPEIP